MNGHMLSEFCHALVNSKVLRDRLQPTDVAREFVEFFDLSAFPRTEELTELLKRAGVGTVVCSRALGGLRR